MKAVRMMKRNLWYPVGIFLLAALAANHMLDVQAGVIESGNRWLMGRYLLLAAVTLVTAVGAGAAFFHFKWRLERIFLCLTLVLGVLYLYVLPPLSAPDEVRHYISAYQLSNRFLGIHVDHADGLVPVRLEDWFIEDSCGDYQPYLRPDGVWAVDGDGADGAKVLGQTLTEETYRLIHEMGISGRKEPAQIDSLYGKDVPDQNTVSSGLALSVHQPVVTTPFAYAAPSVGITLARLLHLNSLWLVYLGRLSNLILYAAVTYLAIRRLPLGKEVLFGVGLLPMTLHLAASFSYDALLLAGLFYFIAHCMYLAYEAERVRIADILILSVTMAIVGPCKMVYAVFMGLCLLIPVKKFGGWRNWLLSAACVLGAWGIFMILINSRTVTSYATETANYIDWAGEAGYSLTVLIHQPIHTLRLFFNTVVWQAELWHLTMIGAYLGNVDQVLDVPYLLVVFLTVSLILLSLRKPGESLHLAGWGRVWVWGLCLLCCSAILASMLLAWTPVSSPIICGVQGRYFLPFLPVFLMTLKNDSVVLTRNCDRTILYLMCCVNLYVVLRMFSIVSMRL